MENLRYKSERSFIFERFSSKFQKNHDNLEQNGWEVTNADIVDSLWKKIQDSSLQTYLAALKVEYQQNPRSYKLILQDIAAEVEDKKVPSFAGWTANINAVYTKEGNVPTSGVHTSDGSIFIGSYNANKWKSDNVKPYHKEIINAQAREGGGSGNKHPSQSNKRKANVLKRSKSKIKKLKSQLKISAAKLEEATMTKDESEDEEGTSNNTGDSFGGK